MVGLPSPHHQNPFGYGWNRDYTDPIQRSEDQIRAIREIRSSAVPAVPFPIRKPGRTEPAPPALHFEVFLCSCVSCFPAWLSPWVPILAVSRCGGRRFDRDQGLMMIPITAPVSRVARVPATIALKPREAIVRLCSGHRAESVPARMPMLLKLANPQSE